MHVNASISYNNTITQWNEERRKTYRNIIFVFFFSQRLGNLWQKILCFWNSKYKLLLIHELFLPFFCVNNLRFPSTIMYCKQRVLDRGTSRNPKQIHSKTISFWRLFRLFGFFFVMKSYILFNLFNAQFVYAIQLFFTKVHVHVPFFFVSITEANEKNYFI